MKNLAILGSTGSVGRQTCSVAFRYPDRFRVQLLAANKDYQTMEQQIRMLKPRVAVMADEQAARELAGRVADMTVTICFGNESLGEQITKLAPEMAVAAMVGHAGLLPVITAIQAGCDIALANKEVLVMAGQLIKDLQEKHQVKLLPMDSEHSAIFQCLQDRNILEVRRLILTASGGPFRGWTRERLATVSPVEAIAHPNWSMGAKISVDSATLMNKGLEVIEARWLFDIPGKTIDVLIHPQSIIHSMVELIDGSIIGQLGVPTMELPIQYALSWPERLHSSKESYLDWTSVRSLTFEAPDRRTFRCLDLAYLVLERGGTAPAALSVANDYCVEAFLQGKISITDIPEILEEVITSVPLESGYSIETLLGVTGEARVKTMEAIKIRGD